jgi:hypothetical protein
MDVWKYGQILTIQKSLTIKHFIILYYITYWIPITNLEGDLI